MAESNWVKEQLEEMVERFGELQAAEEAVINAIAYVEEAEYECPSGIMFSHHALMELNDTLSQIQSEMETLERKVQ